MKKERVEKLISVMKEKNIYQEIISDPYSIFYFTNKWIFPGERLLALYINIKGDVKLLVNELFPQEKDPDMEIYFYNDIENGVEILSKYVNKDKSIGIDKDWPSEFLLELQRIYPESKYINGSIIVDKIRQIKDLEEREIMKKSSKINDEVMKEVISKAANGLSELELSAFVKETYKKHNVNEVSFDPITAFGKNGADPHHSTDESKGKAGDSLVIDIGGMYKNYASDMTRTVFLKEVSDKQIEVYEIVKEANRRAIRMAKPGNRMCDVDFAARDYIEEKGYGKYFTHRTGHSIGLKDHEAGDVSSVNEEIIEVGQVFSVEPGIYLPDENFGVRIEDLVLITEDGCEVLNNFTKDLLVI